MTDYDKRALDFAREYSRELLAIDVNIDVTTMLDTAWQLFGKYFTRDEVAIKQEFMEQYWRESKTTKGEQ